MQYDLREVQDEINDVEGFLALVLGVRSSCENYRNVLRHDPCSFCGHRCEHMTVDHITPLAAGGHNGWFNLTGACYQCNTQKRTRSLLSFLYNIRQHEVMYGL